MPVNFEKETPIRVQVKDNFDFIKSQCRKRAGINADELLSIVLEKVWKYRESFDGTNFKGWVSTIIKNSNIDLHRGPVYSEEPVENHYNLKLENEPDFSDKQLLKVVIEIVEKNFSKKNNIAFRMHIIEGYKYREIEELTGIHSMTSRGAVRRILIFLKANKQLMKIWEQ